MKNHPNLYIIIDGIDECDREHRRDISVTLQAICESLPPDETDSIRCMFVCQDDKAAAKDFASIQSLKVTEAEIKQDIRIYASDWSSKIAAKFGLNGTKQKHVGDMITEKAEGKILIHLPTRC